MNREAGENIKVHITEEEINNRIAEIGADSDLANKDVKVGDMIIAVNGKEMTNSSMLADMIEEQADETENDL